MIDLQKLCKITLENAEKRQKNGANISTDTRKMLKHCATEVVEAAEAYSEYRFVKDCGVKSDRSYFAGEIADIICCCLIIANVEGIDIEQALNDCYEKNRKRANKEGDKL